MANNKIILLPCAGDGTRFKGTIPKQYTLINGQTILQHTLKVFLSLEQIDRIVIVTAPGDIYIDKLLLNIGLLKSELNKIEVLKVGGKTRALSVRNGLAALNCTADDWVLVHDVARCCITRDAVLRLIKQLENDLIGGILAIPAVDTIKQSIDGHIIDKTVDRRAIFQAQTPQMFRVGVLQDALNLADLTLVTDDASAVEQANLAVKLIMGEAGNIKITYPLDIKLAEVILNHNTVL